MVALILSAVALVIAGGVVLGWRLLRRPVRHWTEDPHPVPDWPGFDRYKGNIRFTKHAVEEMQKDRITPSIIPIVLANAITSPAKDGKTKYVGTAPDTREVTIIATQEGKNLVIVTVYWDDADRRKLADK